MAFERNKRRRRCGQDHHSASVTEQHKGSGDAKKAQNVHKGKKAAKRAQRAKKLAKIAARVVE